MHIRLNGVRVKYNESFPNGCMYPGDSRGAPCEVYNCRCTMVVVAITPHADQTKRTSNTAESYKAWKEEKLENRFVEKAAEKLVLTTKKQKNVAVQDKSDIINSGARIVDVDSDEAMKFADMYYDEIRSFSTDTRKIAKNLGKNENDIKKIKSYLFENNSMYDPVSQTYSRFDADCGIAQSWQRLMIGKDIKPHDRTLIEHELLEMKIKEENPTLEHWKAHELATKK